MLQYLADDAIANIYVHDTYANVVVKHIDNGCHPKLYFYDGNEHLLSYDIVVDGGVIFYDGLPYRELVREGWGCYGHNIDYESGGFRYTRLNKEDFVTPDDNALNEFEAIFVVDYQQHKQPCVHPFKTYTNTVPYGNHVMRIVTIPTPRTQTFNFVTSFDYEIYIDDKFVTHLTDYIFSMYYDHTYDHDDLSLSTIEHGVSVKHTDVEFNIYHVKYGDVHVVYIPTLDILSTPPNMFAIRDNYRCKVFAVDNIYPYIGYIDPDIHFADCDDALTCVEHFEDYSYFGSVCDMLIQHFVPNVRLQLIWNTYRNNVWYIRKHGLDFFTEMNMFYGFELSKYATCKYEVWENPTFRELDSMLYDYALTDRFLI